MKENLHRVIEPILAIAILLLSIYGMASAETWVTEPVDRYGDRGTDNSIALDSAGQPHISYREFDWWEVTDYLKYASYDGMAWHVQYVDMIGDVGFASSLALDSGNHPSIAYHDCNLNLKYATNSDGSTWRISTIGKGANPSLVVDKSDRPQVSYFKPYFSSIVDLRSGSQLTAQHSDLMYARWDGTSWQVETVEQGGRLGEDNSLALDSRGNPHIAYRDYGVTGAMLKYATRDGAGWRIMTVDSHIVDSPQPYFNAQNFSIAVDSADRPCISYFAGGYDLKYAILNGGSWSIETVASRPGIYELPNSLALDSLDRPHIVYHDQYQVPSALRYATKDESGWRFETIDSGNVPGLRNSITVDAANQPHISYYVGINGEGGGALNYARLGASRTVTANPPGGLFESAQSVKLSTSNSLDAIYYTTDGSTPSAISTRYNQFYPIAIAANRTTVLKFFAIDSRGNAGEVQTETYTVDTSTPLYLLTVNNSGSGSGGLLANNLPLAWSDFAATAKYRSGTTVTLTPQCDFGTLFNGWSGACTGTGNCELTMDAPKEVTASYRSIVAGSGLVSVSAGAYHNMVLNLDGQVATWGLNGDGQLGDGTRVNRNVPNLVPGLSGVRAIAAGGGHSLALKNDGTVVAWGLNQNGQVGDGTNLLRTVPTPVTGLSGVTAIAAGFGHSLALKSDGTVLSWGFNGNGQLGDGSTTSHSAPIPVSGLSGVKAIAAGTYHSMALKNDGTVVAWGYNANGRLGDSTTTQRTLPARVSGLTGVTAIAAGTHHSLALRWDGTVAAWGLNTSYQLGDWAAAEQYTPTTVPQLSGVKAIAAGGLHSLALKNDNTLQAWGENTNAQLGDGTTTQRVYAAAVPKLTSLAAASAGMYHSVALRDDGMVLAWGLNNVGELGDATTTSRMSPVQVKFALSQFPVTVAGSIENGSVTCTTPVSYNNDSVCTITASPGYTVATLTVNGADRSAELSGGFFVIRNVKENQTIAASFAPAAPAPPGAPQSVAATAGGGEATVTFAPPADGGGGITSYTVTSTPGGITKSGTESPILITGLVNGVAYTFTVTATNAAGTGPASTPSNSVTPVAAENGVCGSASGGTFPAPPGAALCASGIPSPLSGSGPWNWSCSGSNGGSTASCSANYRSSDQGVQIALRSGWNFIGWSSNQGYYQGTPPQVSEYATDSLMTDLGTGSIAAPLASAGLAAGFIVVGPNAVVYMPNSPFNTLTKLLPGKGYWIYTGSDRAISLPGAPLLPSQQLPLPAGWTPVAFWGDDGLPPVAALGCLGNLYDIVVDGGGKVHVSGSPFNTLSVLQRNKGYFIHTTGPGALRFLCQ